eukprot:6172532-Pleurochrysis_carterae.AAC.1
MAHQSSSLILSTYVVLLLCFDQRTLQAAKSCLSEPIAPRGHTPQVLNVLKIAHTSNAVP